MNKRALIALMSLCITNSQPVHNDKKDCKNNNSSKRLSRLYKQKNNQIIITRDPVMAESETISINTLTKIKAATLKKNDYGHSSHVLDDQSEYPCNPSCNILCFILNCCCLGPYL